MAGTDKEKLRSIRGTILERINKEGYQDYGNFSQKLAQNIKEHEDITEQQIIEMGKEVNTAFLEFNEIENPEKLLKRIHTDLERL